MSEIPHARIVNVIKDPPLQVLHVGTELPERPLSQGFSAEKKQELLKAIAEKVARECLDGYKVHWSDSGTRDERTGNDAARSVPRGAQ
jgi:hypothetical protein